MPRISSFYGIVIRMYYDETRHIARPHFHAAYAGREASIDVETLEIIAGSLPARAMRMVTEWAGAHRRELDENWRRARSSQPLRPIEPLR